MFQLLSLEFQSSFQNLTLQWNLVQAELIICWQAEKSITFIFKTSRMEQNGKVDKCEICSEPCNKFCSGCKKVYYCSANHQKLDRKVHKKDCFPAILVTDEVQGRHFVATKDLKPGDLVFKDKAVISGPSGAEPFFHKICLGCYNVVKTSYKCSKCNWPVCNAKCEKVKHHSEFECKVFEKEKVEPYFTKSFEYDLIKFLRSLLLKDIDANKWEELTILASHAEARSKIPEAVAGSNASFKFIRSICKLEQFDYETVNHIVGVWGVNSFGANPPSGPCPVGSIASFLFPRTSLASHSCIANTRGILLEEFQDSVPSYSMELLASLPIKSGSPIFITYADVGEGTFERRQVLLDNYYFACTCRRCKDPTEFETYLSAFKCLKCPLGYLLMKDPLDFNTPWNCDNDECSATTEYKELTVRIFKIKGQLHKIDHKISNAGDNKNRIELLEKILVENQGIMVHPNHWLMMEIEFQLIRSLLICIQNKKAKHFANANTLNRLEELCDHSLTVANVVRPGHNSYRGKILYCLAQAKLETILRRSQGKEDFFIQCEKLESLKSSTEEGFEILSREPEGSEERRIANTLKANLEQIKRMLQVSDSQSN